MLVNLNGAEHLRPCLDSLAAQDYPSELTEVIVVDNGSTDGSLELLAAEYPWVARAAAGRQHRLRPGGHDRSTGGRGRVRGVRQQRHEGRRPTGCPSWSAPTTPAAASFASPATSRAGTARRVDFVEGVMNFYGMGHQVGFGRPVGAVEIRDGQPAAVRLRRLDAREPARLPHDRRLRPGLLRLLRGRRLRMAALGARLRGALRRAGRRLPPHARHLVALPRAPAHAALRAQRAAIAHQELQRRAAQPGARARLAPACQAGDVARQPRAVARRVRHRRRPRADRDRAAASRWRTSTRSTTCSTTSTRSSTSVTESSAPARPTT